jgi:outer membrane protein assembly factor BamB
MPFKLIRLTPLSASERFPPLHCRGCVTKRRGYKEALLSCSKRQVVAVAAVVVIFVVTGCGPSGSSSSSSANSEAPGITPVLHQPTVAWIAPNPGETPQGGAYASYEALAASGNVMVGVTFSEPEGSVLIRLNPKNGEPIWKAKLPTYAEQNALSIKDGRILLVAPGERLTPEGIEGEGPAMAYAFSLNGAKIWEQSLGVSISGVEQSSWSPPTLPDGGETVPPLIADMNAIPGEIIVYEGAELRGLNDRTGAEWVYSPYPTPEGVSGPDPGGADDLHLINGLNQLLIDGHTGKEVKRERGAPGGSGIGLIGPVFEQAAAENELPVNVPGFGDLRPVTIDAGGNVVFGTTDHALIAIDSTNGKELWKLPMDLSYPVDAAAGGDSYMLMNETEGTQLLKE